MNTSRIHFFICILLTLVIISRYEFFINDTLSHRGDEVFTFLKKEGKWLITGSTYTIEVEK